MTEVNEVGNPQEVEIESPAPEETDSKPGWIERGPEEVPFQIPRD